MSDQASLLDLLRRPEIGGYSDAAETHRECRSFVAFASFDSQHPDVYRELVALARKTRHAGRDEYGIGSLWEVMRWHRAIRGDTDPDGFKLNNNFRSWYARLIMEREDDLEGFFETRVLRCSDCGVRS